MHQGIALSADPNYKVLAAAYPWIARRLLTEESGELRETLRALLYKGPRFQFHRLESLLRQATRSPPHSGPALNGGVQSGASALGSHQLKPQAHCSVACCARCCARRPASSPPPGLAAAAGHALAAALWAQWRRAEHCAEDRHSSKLGSVLPCDMSPTPLRGLGTATCRTGRCARTCIDVSQRWQLMRA